MESVGKEDTFAQHPLVPSGELNLGDGECMAEMKASVHVWVGEVTEPFGVLGLYFGGRETGQLRCGWGVDLEEMLIFPARLILFLEVLQVVAFGRLPCPLAM